MKAKANLLFHRNGRQDDGPSLVRKGKHHKHRIRATSDGQRLQTYRSAVGDLAREAQGQK
jgi:hypothetical protein